MRSLIERITDPVSFWTSSWRDLLARKPGAPGRASLQSMRARVRERLTAPDREQLAISLYIESGRIASAGDRRQSFSNAAWVAAAGMVDDPANPTKRLNEYVLPPYGEVHSTVWEARASRLNATTSNYLRLIDALLRFTDEDAEWVLQRIFAGSSFSISTDDAARYGRLADQLEELAAQTDRLVGRVQPGTSLSATFARTADAKVRLLRAGCPAAWWPYFAPLEPLAPETAPPDPYWDLTNDYPYNATAPSMAGYRRMLMPPLDWLEGLMYLPRVYLGCAIRVPDWVDAPQSDVERVGRLFAHAYDWQSTLAEVRHPITGEMHCDAPGALKSMDPALRGTAWSPETREISAEGHCWLVIYPARGRAGLCPLLYWVLGEAGVHACVLNQANLHALSEIHVPSEAGIISLIERIEQLLDDPSQPLAREWARSAFDLQHNPVLVQERLAAGANHRGSD